MPVVSCPSCNSGLGVDAADLGHRVRCPACQAVFTADTSPASPPPPPAPAPDSHVVVCTECRADVSVAAEDVGHLLQCPRCNGMFVAADPAGGRAARPESEDDRGPGWRRRQSERRSRSGDEDDDEYDRRRRRRRSRYDEDDEFDRRRRLYEDSPAGLIEHAKQQCGAAGIGMIVIAALGLLSGIALIVLMGLALGGMFPFDDGPGGPDPVELWLNLGSGILQLFVSVFLLYVGIQLRQARNWGLCVTGCVIALIPYFSPCCALGLAFGIIGITKLNDPRVKKGFEANRPGYQGDGYN